MENTAWSHEESSEERVANPWHNEPFRKRKAVPKGGALQIGLGIDVALWYPCRSYGA